MKDVTKFNILQDLWPVALQDVKLGNILYVLNLYITSVKLMLFAI